MGKEQVIDYVMNSPANTNKAVLEGMLDGMGGANVPTPTTEDAGKVLGVNENGSYVLTKVSSSADASTVIMHIIDADSQNAYTYISEEDANKVFNGYPLGFKFASIPDNADDGGTRVGMHLAAEELTLAMYTGSMEGMNVLMIFTPQESINTTIKQGDTVLQTIDLEWDAGLKRYHTKTSA